MYKSVDTEVIIVGSGMAGLSAAFCLYLKEPSLDFTVLESTENIGGRAFSVPLLVAGGDVSYCDVGCQWICREQNHLMDLLDRLEIPIIPIQRQGKIIVECKNTYVVDTVKDILKFLSTSDKFQFTKFVIKVEILCRRVKEKEDVTCVKELSQITLEDLIQDSISSKTVQAIIDYIVCFNCGVRPSQMSALFYIFFCISTKGVCNQLPVDSNNLELRIKGGARSICNRIADEIGREHIFMEEQVTEVICSPRYVEVKTKGVSYYCHDVIMAVSPKDILKIKFSPPLPEKKVTALRMTTASAVTNFVVTYPRDFWADTGLSGDIYVFDKRFTKGPIDFCVNITNFNKPVLSGRILEGVITDNKGYFYKNSVLHQLSNYFGVEALRPIDYYEQSWSLGNSQMVCWKVGNVSYISDVSTSNDRLFWAGAETSAEWYGCLGGAVYSGIRAALEVLYDLRPAVLTVEDMLILSPTRRSSRKPLRQYPKSFIYSAAVYWSYYLTVGVFVLLLLWKCRK